MEGRKINLDKNSQEYIDFVSEMKSKKNEAAYKYGIWCYSAIGGEDEWCIYEYSTESFFDMVHSPGTLYTWIDGDYRVYKDVWIYSDLDSAIDDVFCREKGILSSDEYILS